MKLVLIHIGVPRTSRGAGDCSFPESGKTVIFRANAKFFGQKPTAKNKKSIYRTKKNGIHSIQRDEVPDN